MSNLFVNAVESVKRADSLTKELGALLAKVEAVSTDEVSAVGKACADSYAWFVSVNRKHGGKSELAAASGVSQKTIGRYIASGHVELVCTDSAGNAKVLAQTVNSAINNYDMAIGEVEKVKSVTEWRKLLKSAKDAKRNGAGKVKGKSEEAQTDSSEADAGEAPTKSTKATWKELAEQLIGQVKSGKIDLESVTDYMSELIAELEAVEAVAV